MVFSILPDSWFMRIYERETDERVRRNPRLASGLPDEVISRHVIRYALQAGLQEHHSVLDFGCGTMRTGQHLIRYLHPRKYFGVDISHGAIRYSQEVISESEELRAKKPRVMHVGSDEELPDSTPRPDFILAHSVFTHLPRGQFRRNLAKLGNVMGNDTILAFTIFEGRDGSRKSYRSFQYRVDTVVAIGRELGLDLHVMPGEWHPTQTVIVGRLAT